MLSMSFTFWIAVFLLGYTYVGYPLVIRLWGMLRPHSNGSRRLPAPMVTLLVVAHNEAKHIRQRLDNFLDLDYLWDRVEIIVASDGSTDDTVALARGYESPLIRIVEFTQRRGKSAVLNDVLPLAKGEIIVLTDARQQLETNAVRRLVDDFADPSVGVVGGELVLLDSNKPSEIGQGADAYWRYEKWIRRQESLVDSSVGVTGALYAIRRRLFHAIPAGIILDDVLIPMQVVRQGYRVLFEPRARAYDWIAETGENEFKRKLRTIAGNFQLFFLQPWLLNPAANRIWFQTLSHKAIRLLSPFLLAVAFLSNWMLAGQASYHWLLWLQAGFYAAASLGYLMRGARHKTFLFSVPYAFCLLNLATVVALVRLLNGRQQVTWEKTLG